MINTVIFDLDGVLWELDFEKLGNLVANDLDIPKIYYKDFGQKLQNAINLILKKTDTKMTKEIVTDIVKDIAQEYNLDPNQIYEALTSENYNFCNNNKNALDVIIGLHKKGYKLVVKSNWFENVQRANLRRYGYLPYFDKVVGIIDDYLKPNIKSLDKIIECKSIQDFIIIGDTPQKEVKLANLLGMKSIWLNTNNRDIPKDKDLIPTYEITNITDILDIL